VRAALEIAGLAVCGVGAIICVLLLVVGYLAAIGAGIGALVGGAVWVFRALTGI
jgi:hypothetical protein